jgi:hypothetical protein
VDWPCTPRQHPRVTAAPVCTSGKGSGIAIWNMQSVDVPSLAEPTLIDPALLGGCMWLPEPCSWISTRV